MSVQYLTNSKPYNLQWLFEAMTLASNHLYDHYYYDGKRRDFFHTSQENNKSYLVYLDRFDTEYPIDICVDLSIRLALINNGNSEIVEIPRLSVAEKIRTQLEFLSDFPDTNRLDDLIAAVEQQRDESNFVLDFLLLENGLATMVPYWDEYKLNLSRNCLSELLK